MAAGRVADKVAVVVGGGQTPGETIGNGRATALLLAREGARVVVADRSLASAEETVAMIAAEGGEAFACAADVTDEDAVKRHDRRRGRAVRDVDILHNNVGASIALGDARADEMTVEAFDRSFAVNFKSAWLTAKHALPVMRQRGGSIVNISSLAAWEAYPLVGYKTMKAAVLALTPEPGRGQRALRRAGQRHPAGADEHAHGDRGARGAGRQPRARSSPRATGACRSATRWAPPGTSPTRRCSCTRTKPASSPAPRCPSTAAPRPVSAATTEPKRPGHDGAAGHAAGGRVR